MASRTLHVYVPRALTRYRVCCVTGCHSDLMDCMNLLQVIPVLLHFGTSLIRI